MKNRARSRRLLFLAKIVVIEHTAMTIAMNVVCNHDGMQTQSICSKKLY